MAESGVGRVIDNKYEILAPIGKGGMSYVWLARDKRLDKMWAVKEYRPSTMSSQSSANRQAIIDEANFIKRLDHPAIPRVVDIIDTGTSIFVAMDFVDGTALNKVLRQQGKPFEQERVIEWGIQLCDVLEYLHNAPSTVGHPVVYRDMKPANVMLRGDDTVKLVDFGISMELLPSGPSDARVIGTGGYGAPEQVDPNVHKLVAVDTRADIYALGATLYSLVTGHVPRQHKDETGKASVDFTMRPVREWDGQLSEGLEHILLKATHKDPNQRYQSAAEMRYDLEHYEELTKEYRAVQQAKVAGFTRRLITSGVLLAVGVICLLSSYLVRNSSYDALLHEASVAPKEERNEQIGGEGAVRTRTADASEAEDLYARAMAVDPGRIDTYFDLIDLYEDDSLFTATEARRWSSLWQSYGRQIEADSRYGELCYNVGILYLVYYDYADARSITGGDSSQAVTGQGAIENATQAIRWFQMALNHPGGLDATRRDSAIQYVAIGDFYQRVTKANREGDEAVDIYSNFWNTISDMVVGTDGAGPSVADSQPIVQLRVYQVAFESVGSSTYLTGFRRAGVTREQADKLLSATESATRALESFVETNRNAAGALYDEIVDGEDEARANIARTYNSKLSQPVATDASDAKE